MSNKYISPFSTRYASDDMQHLFSEQYKFSTWRKLWVALAKSQKQLGLDINDEQIEELEGHIEDINFKQARKIESETRHDVMSHVKAYGLQCPKAKGIIHLGATSCFVGDNTDVIIMRDGLNILSLKIKMVMKNLAEFADKYKELPTLGFTHYQPAQLVTVGKRATLWLHDLYLDLEELQFVLQNLKLRGVKGTTGTQASFLSLFDQDHEKVKKLDQLIADHFGFESSYPVTGQTYSRKIDTRVLNVLGQIATSATKFSNDIRLLSNLKEVEEPFEEKQIGSSAMAYKRNPMRCERMTSIARFVISNTLNGAMTAATQWLERTLDDSANRRLSLAEGFLAVDSILNIYINVSENLIVYPNVIEKRVMEELPFMATETILMEAVKNKKKDRQILHEKIRVHAMESAKMVKEKGLENDLIKRIENDKEFAFSKEELSHILDPKKFIGRSVEQVDEFLRDHIQPIIDQRENKDIKGVELKV